MEKKCKTTFVRITFGFDKNKFGGSRFYRKSEGKNLKEAVQNLFRPRYNNSVSRREQEEVLRQFKGLKNN